MGNSSSSFVDAVSDVVNESLTSINSEVSASTDQTQFQDAVVKVTLGTGVRTCAPTLHIDSTQAGSIVSFTQSTGDITGKLTTSIMNKADQMAKLKSTQKNSGIFTLKHNSSDQDINFIDKKRNKVQQAVSSSIKSTVSQDQTQKNLVEFTDNSSYPPATFYYPGQDPCAGKSNKEEYIGLKQVLTTVSSSIAKQLVKIFSDTNLKNLSAQTGEATSSQTNVMFGIGSVLVFLIIAVCLYYYYKNK